MDGKRHTNTNGPGRGAQWTPGNHAVDDDGHTQRAMAFNSTLFLGVPSTFAHEQLGREYTELEPGKAYERQRKTPVSSSERIRRSSRWFQRPACIAAVIVIAALVACSVLIPVLLAAKGSKDEVTSYSEFDVEVTVDNMGYNPDMANNASLEFITNAINFCNGIDVLLLKSTMKNGYEGCLVKEIRNGSLVMAFTLVFQFVPNATPLETDVLAVLSDGKLGDEHVPLGGFEYKASSINIRRPAVSVTNSLDTVVCGPIPSVTNGEATSSGVNYGDILNITCNEGYSISGTSQLTCKMSNSWGIMSTCSINLCGNYSTPAHSIPSSNQTSNHTYGSNVTFVCEADYTLEGNSTIRCLEDGSWSAVPVCMHRACPSLQDRLPENSDTNISMTTNYTEGLKLKVTCKKGYELVHYTTCSLRENWLGVNVCEQIMCNPFIPSSNSRIINESTTNQIYVYGSKLTVACDSGYTMLGNTTAEITCMSNKQWSTTPKCEPVNCGQPSLPKHAVPAIVSNSLLHGNFTVTCTNGYFMSGNSEITCLPSGSWSEMPECEPVDCGPVMDIEHDGLISSTGTRYRDEATYVCEEGYEAAGTLTVTCTSTGDWSSYPECLPLSCGNVSVQHGSVNGSDGLFGDVLEVTCDTGFNLAGNAFIQCQSDGHWSEIPRCNQVVCKDTIVLPEHGYLSCHITEVTFSDHLIMNCSAGYAPDTDGKITCLADGTWTDVPNCIPVPCPIFTFPNHSKIVGNVNETMHFRDTIAITCEEYYAIKGDSTVTCEANGLWSDSPICEHILCSEIRPPSNGHFKTTMTESSPVDAVYTIECYAGFNIIGSQTITCLNNETWSMLPTCSPVKCNRLTIPNNGEIIDGSSEEAFYKDRVTIKCNIGYVILGNKTLTCHSDMSWDPLPECKAVECPDFVEPIGGFIVQSSVDISPKFGDSLVIDCNEGYYLRGNATTICQHDKTWSSPPRCEIIRCPAMVTIDNGYIQVLQVEDREYMDSVEAVCNDGYESTGTVTCTSDGTWDADNACTIVDCGEHTDTIQHGRVVNTTGTTYGSQVLFGCDEQYILTGPNPIKCQANKEWEENPVCVMTDCDTPDNVQNGHVRIINASTYEIVCDSGYSVNGPSTFQCESGGSQTEIPVCQIISCTSQPSDSDIQNGRITETTGTAFGSSVSFECNPGYRLVGNSVVVCRNTGDWDEIPKCVPVVCGIPEQLIFGRFVGTLDMVFKSTLEAECLPGYTHKNDLSTTTCRETGMWSDALECIPIECPQLLIENGAVVEYSNENKFGSVARYSCSAGFQTIDCVDSVACNASGLWDISSGCRLIDCGTPAPPIHGQLQGFSNTKYNTSIQVTCDTGYALQGDNSIICRADGEWSNGASCELVDCGDLTSPAGGTIVTSTTTYKSIAVVICDKDDSVPVICSTDGDWLVYSTNTLYIQRDCGEKETVNCGIPNDVNHGIFVNVSGIKSSDSATVECDVGYQLNGSETIVCDVNGNGVWSDYPTCGIADCGKPRAPANARQFTDGKTTYESTFDITCIDGFSRKDNDSMECMADGFWTVVKGCVIDCGEYELAEHVVVESQSGMDLNSVIVVRCEEGYYLFNEDTDSVRCTERGVWEGDPYCIDKEQGQPYLRCFDDTVSEQIGLEATTECHVRDIGTVTSMLIQLNGTELYNQAASEISGRIEVANEINVEVNIASQLLIFTIPALCKYEGTFSVNVNGIAEDDFQLIVLSNPKLQRFEVPADVHLHQLTEFTCTSDLGRNGAGGAITTPVLEYKPQHTDEYITFAAERFLSLSDDDTCLYISTLTLSFNPDQTYNNSEFRCSLMSTLDPTQRVEETLPYKLLIKEQNVRFKDSLTKTSVFIGEPLTLECFADDVPSFKQMSLKKNGETIATLLQSGDITDFGGDVEGEFVYPHAYLKYGVAASQCSTKGEYTCHVSLHDASAISTLMDVHMLRLPSYPDLDLSVEIIEHQSPWADFPTGCSGDLGYPMGTLYLEAIVGGSLTQLNATVDYTNNDRECTSTGKLTYFHTYTMDWEGAEMRCVMKNEHIFPTDYELFVSRTVRVIQASYCDDKPLSELMEHPVDCFAGITCTGNRIVPRYNCPLKTQCYNRLYARCESCEETNRCPVITESNPVAPPPSALQTVLTCPRTILTNKGDDVTIVCTLSNEQIDINNPTAWNLTVSNSESTLLDTVSAPHMVGNGGAYLNYAVSADLTVQISPSSIETFITLTDCTRAGRYTFHYAGETVIRGVTEIIIPASAGAPQLSKSPGHYYRNQESVVTCSGNAGNPPAQLFLRSQGPVDIGEHLTASTTLHLLEVDETTCGYIRTLSYTFYVTEQFDNTELYCEMVPGNGSVLQSDMDTVDLSEPLLLFGETSEDAPLHNPFTMECRWKPGLNVASVVIRRNVTGSNGFEDVLTYTNGEVVEPIARITGQFAENVDTYGKSLTVSITNMTCTNEGEYLCELNLEDQTVARVRKLIYATDVPGNLTLRLPVRLVLDSQTLHKTDYLQCTAQVGYRRPYDIRFEYLSTSAGIYKPFTLGQEIQLENSTRDCNTTLTRKRHAILFDGSWNGTSLRCVVYNTVTQSVVSASGNQTILLINDHCDGTNDETFDCHPYNCHLYTRCHDSGFVTVGSCGAKCVFIRDFPVHEAECNCERSQRGKACNCD